MVPCFYGDFQWTQDINNKPCLLKNMKMLPGVTFLNLSVISNGHAFGASLFHVLRLCSSIRKLTLHISGKSPELEVIKVICCLCIYAFDRISDPTGEWSEVVRVRDRGTSSATALRRRPGSWSQQRARNTTKALQYRGTVHGRERELGG